MQLKRTLVPVASVALLGLVPITTASTAGAAELPVVATTVTVERLSNWVLVHGETTTLVIAVKETVGDTSVFDGTTQLQQSVRGGPWTNVGGETRSGGYVPVADVRVSENTQFRALYSGAQGYASNLRGEAFFTPGTSASLTVKVARKITAPKRGFLLKGKVTPAFGGKKLVIKTSRRSTSGYSTWKKVRVARNGTYKVRLPRRQGLRYWKVIVPADSRFATNSYIWRTQVF